MIFKKRYVIPHPTDAFLTVRDRTVWIALWHTFTKRGVMKSKLSIVFNVQKQVQYLSIDIGIFRFLCFYMKIITF